MQTINELSIEDKEEYLNIIAVSNQLTPNTIPDINEIPKIIPK